MLAGLGLSAALTSPPAQHRGSTLDLKIGAIVTNSDEPDRRRVDGGSYRVDPGEMITVISEEQFALPNDVTGLVMPKSSYYSLGLLTLGIGIVDPGWSGPVSTILINFGSSPKYLRVGDSVLRVAFFAHDATQAASARPTARETYLRTIEDVMAANLGRKFLNLDEVANAASKEMFRRANGTIAVWAGLLALVFGLIAILTPFAANSAAKLYSETQIRELRKADIAFLEAQLQAVESLTAAVRRLETRLDEVSQRLPPASTPKQPSPARPTP